jgi:branched-chain amino acid transport system substrate-binding protein
VIGSARAVHGSVWRCAAILVALAAMASGCGHRMDNQELVARNSRVLEGGGSVVQQPGAEPGATTSVPARTDADPASSAGAGAGKTGGATASGAAPAGSGSSGIATSGVRTKETGPIVIGSVGNYSGLASGPQAPMVRGLRVWTQYVNSRGGLFGRQLQLVVVDDRGDPAQHVAALRDLVENRKAVAFVENAAELTIASGRQYLESAGVPVIGGSCTSAIEFSSPMFFSQCSPISDLYYGIVKSGVKHSGGRTKMALLSCLEAQVCTDSRATTVDGGAASRAGGNLVYDARFSVAQPDFTSECQQASSRGAELLQIIADASAIARVAQSCSRQGYEPVYVQGSATVGYDTKDIPGITDLIVSTQVFPFTAADTPARAEFQQVMKSFYDRSPGPGEAYGWTAAKLFETAATRAAQATQSLTRQTLLDALHSFKGETLDGLAVPLTFPAGRPSQNAPCWFVMRAQGGKWSVLEGGKPVCR